MSESESETYNEEWDNYLEDLGEYEFERRLNIFEHIQNTSMDKILHQPGLITMYRDDFQRVFKDHYISRHDEIMDEMFEIVDIETPQTFMKSSYYMNKYEISRIILNLVKHHINIEYVKDDLYHMVGTNSAIEMLINQQVGKK